MWTCAFAFDVGENGETTGELIGRLAGSPSMGVQTVIGFVPEVYRIAPLEAIGREVIPAVSDF